MSEASAKQVLMEMILLFSAERQERIAECETVIRALMKDFGDDGVIALTIVGLEIEEAKA